MPLLARWHWVAVIVLGLVGSRAAEAQIIDQYFPQGVPGYDTGLGVTVQSRARNEYYAPGVRVGDIIVKPVLTEGFGYNSNVTGVSKGQSSLMMNTALLLQVSTDWARNGMFGYLSVDQQNYLDLPDQNQLSWVGALGGTHDFGRDQLAVSYSHFNLQQTAVDVGALNFQTPATYHVDDFRTSYKIDLGRFSVTPDLQITDYTFSQATIAGLQNGQQYRDRVLVLGSVAIRYEFSPQRNAILVLDGYETQYIDPQPGQPSRNNTGASALFGVEYTANGVFRYRGLIGLEQRSYASDLFASQTALVGEANVIWTPTELSTVTLAASRSIEDAASESAVGFVYSTVRLTVDHEYRRNILLQAVGGLQSASFEQNGGSQTIAFGGASASWLLNRNVQFVVSYNYATSSAHSGAGNFAGNDYQQNFLQLQLRLQL